MFVCYVKHENSDKKYLFNCTKLSDKISVGSKVICNTKLGEVKGAVVSSPINLKGSTEDRNKILKDMGVYFPLKAIIGVYNDKMILNKIRITKAFSETYPLTEKISARYEYYRKHKRFDREIILSKNNTLTDRYTVYLVAKMLGLKEVEVYIK